jgi:hypothetical protein
MGLLQAGAGGAAAGGGAGAARSSARSSRLQGGYAGGLVGGSALRWGVAAPKAPKAYLGYLCY